MNYWGADFATGIVTGLVIGLSFGRRQKPWSESSPKGKRFTIVLIALGVVLLLTGIVILYLLRG
jgi:hypothetical protein